MSDEVGDQQTIAETAAQLGAIGERDHTHKLEVKCRYGDEGACTALASIYRFACSAEYEGQTHGRHSSTSNDSSKDKASSKGLTACSRLADLYLRGAGVAQDTVAAEKLLRAGCQRKHVQSCFTLGVLKNFGFPERTSNDNTEASSSEPNTIAVDKGEAEDYLTVACFNGHGIACSILAHNFNQMPRTPRNVATTAALFHRACKLNHMPSCSNFGQMCVHGVGLAQPDLKLARQCLSKACIAKQISACEALEKLDEKEKEMQNAKKAPK